MGRYRVTGSGKTIKKQFSSQGDCYFIFNRRRYNINGFTKCCDELVRKGFTHFFLESSTRGIMINNCEDCVYAYNFNVIQY